MWKGQHFSWMAYERFVFSRQNNKKCSVLTSCGSLPLWNYPGIAPDLSWAGEEWLVGREKRTKGQYGSVKLEISNWRKISAFKANKPFEWQERGGGGGEVGAALHLPLSPIKAGKICAMNVQTWNRGNHLCNAAPTSPPFPPSCLESTLRCFLF